MKITHLPSEQFDQLPYKYLKDAHGVTDQNTGEIYVRQTGDSAMDRFTTEHEIQEMFSPESAHETPEEPGVRYGWFKKAFGFSSQPAMQYVAPVVGGIATLMGHPWIGALLNTAIGGANSQQQGTFDWGNLAKNAAINFGTAAVGDWAGNALKSGQSANSLAASGNTMKQGFNAFQTAADNAAGLNGVSNMGSTALRGFTATAPGALASSSSSALAGFGGSAASTPSTVSMPKFSSDTALPAANATQSSGGFGKMAQTAALKAAPKVAETALTTTLAPTQTTALEGFDTSTPQLEQKAPGSGYQYGDLLNAFGGDAATSQEQITQEQLDEMMNRKNANIYLQQRAADDNYMGAGQLRAPENTPYGTARTNIEASDMKANSDLLNEVNTENQRRYQAQQDAAKAAKEAQISQAYRQMRTDNPWMTNDQAQQYIQDPTQVPEAWRGAMQAFAPYWGTPVLNF